ncbi:MAG TPA: NAD(P)H-quinone oxidoreductase [Bryobacteraceae bacterium]|nr:NAD(P)H-quinone oxidoreductase [Bryobacteraceae bacterium]
MKAVEISSFGGPRVLRICERPRPEPTAGEVLVRVSTAGVARADTLQRQGKYPPPQGASDIPGLDVAGCVESIGPGVQNIQPGQRVCAILAGGGYAEYCVAPQQQVLPIPENWTEIEAATLPENIFTAFDNLITRAGLKSGESALIHGGTSGVGSMAIMLAKAWNARVIATAGSQEKCRACRDFGSDAAINYREGDFVEAARAFTSGHGVDVVLDLVGGAYLARNLDALALEGCISIIATQGGRTAELDIGRLMMKRARIMGSTMRARTPSQKGEVAARLLKQVWPLLPSKTVIRPAIDRVYPLQEAWRAHERMESGEHIGKIVLTIDR